MILIKQNNICSYKHKFIVKSRSWPTRIATKDTSNYLVVLEPQARSLTNREITLEWNNARLWAKGMSSAYIRVKEVRGQVPGGWGYMWWGTHQQCDQQQTGLELRKGARVLLSTPREWRAGTTASRAKGGRPGTTAVVPAVDPVLRR